MPKKNTGLTTRLDRKTRENCDDGTIFVLTNLNFQDQFQFQISIRTYLHNNSFNMSFYYYLTYLEEVASDNELFLNKSCSNASSTFILLFGSRTRHLDNIFTNFPTSALSVLLAAFSIICDNCLAGTLPVFASTKRITFFFVNGSIFS